MVQTCRITLKAALLGLGSLVFALLGSAIVHAADTKDVKGKEPPTAGTTASRFKGKAIELKLKDGKVSYAGELSADDANFQNHHFKVFTVQLEKGKTYGFDHRNAGDDPKFDPLLFLEDAAGNQLEMNDDGNPPNLDSRIVYKATKSGTYRLVATTLIPQQTSKFTLEIGAATVAEAKNAELKYRINNYADGTPAERKDVAQTLIKQFEGNSDKLTFADFQLALQLAFLTEDDGIDQARATYSSLIKAFAGAENKQVAVQAPKFLENELKKIEKHLGKMMPISGKTVDGKDFDLKNLKGKVVLVDFWATWCGPCIQELPNIQQAYKKYHGKGFDVIGVSLDRSDDAITKFVEDRKLPWTSINIEDSKKLAAQYGVNSIPFPVLVDRSGRVVSLRARGPQLDRLLERLMAEKK